MRNASETLLEGERFEIPLADVTLTKEERRSLLGRHTRRDTALRGVWDEVAGEVVEREIRLPNPVCWACGELWGEYGCPTSRAVLLLGILERERSRDARRIAELTEALTPRFGAYRLRESGNKTIELRMFVDEYTLMYGGTGLIDATLMKMGAEWRRWFKNVGDQARARTDKLWALTLDSDRYTWLTTEFNPNTSFIKHPGAPWDAADGVA